MSKVDIISGFLGAGKTTLIKKLLKESFKDEQLVLIENEFGEIGIDGGFMREAGITVNELSQGCICCSLVGDFETALKQVVETYHPDRILIEPSGVGKLSDIIDAVKQVKDADLELDRFFTVVDAKKCKLYHKNFGEFFNNQIASASCVILSRSQEVNEVQLSECLEIIKELNPHAPVVTTPWDEITGDMILEASAKKDALEQALLAAEKEHREAAHHHHITTIITMMRMKTSMNIITIITMTRMRMRTNMSTIITTTIMTRMKMNTSMSIIITTITTIITMAKRRRQEKMMNLSFTMMKKIYTMQMKSSTASVLKQLTSLPLKSSTKSFISLTPIRPWVISCGQRVS